MECLKCGRQTKERNVFCDECLAEMERYPVKPDTPVVLPKRQIRERKNHTKKPTRNEEIIEQLQRRLRMMRRGIAALTVLLVLVTVLLTIQLIEKWNREEIGSNYSTITSTQDTTQTTD